MIRSIKVIGAGLIGTSLGLQMKSQGCAVEMIDIDLNNAKLAQELVKGVALDDPEMVIVCVPAAVTADVVLQMLKDYPEAIICDLASVKSNVINQVYALSGVHQNYVSLHPMAGREISGVESARADLFQGRAWIGIDSGNLEPKIKAKVVELAQICGGSIYWMSAGEHDLAVAQISHLPQILSSLLGTQLTNISPDILNLAGAGLRDVVRLAASDAKLWGQIVTMNSDVLTPLLENTITQLTQLKNSIDEGNAGEIADFFKKGKVGKQKIPGKHGGVARQYSYLPIVIDDKPGELARIFILCSQISVNIEDLTIEHSPGQETGLITLALNQDDGEKLSSHLESAGFAVHPIKNR